MTFSATATPSSASHAGRRRPSRRRRANESRDSGCRPSGPARSSPSGRYRCQSAAAAAFRLTRHSRCRRAVAQESRRTGRCQEPVAGPGSLRSSRRRSDLTGRRGVGKRRHDRIAAQRHVERRAHRSAARAAGGSARRCVGTAMRTGHTAFARTRDPASRKEITDYRGFCRPTETFKRGIDIRPFQC